MNSEFPINGTVLIRLSFKFLFSLNNDELSIALLVRIINLSLLNGFSKKSYAPFFIDFTARSTVP